MNKVENMLKKSVHVCAEMGGQVSTPEGIHVVVVGGGFGGIAAAQQLKAEGLDFTLIDVRDAFHHNVAALRASVQPGSYLSIYLFIYLSIYLFIYLFIDLFIHLFIYLLIYLFIYVLIYLFIYLCIYLFMYLFIYLSIYVLIYLFIYLSIAIYMFYTLP